MGDRASAAARRRRRHRRPTRGPAGPLQSQQPDRRGRPRRSDRGCAVREAAYAARARPAPRRRGRRLARRRRRHPLPRRRRGRGLRRGRPALPDGERTDHDPERAARNPGIRSRGLRASRSVRDRPPPRHVDQRHYGARARPALAVRFDRCRAGGRARRGTGRCRLRGRRRGFQRARRARDAAAHRRRDEPFSVDSDRRARYHADHDALRSAARPKRADASAFSQPGSRVTVEHLVVRIGEDPAAAQWAVFDDDGRVVRQLQDGSLEEAAALAPGRRVVVLVPAFEVITTEATLPKASPAKLRKMLPFSLEDQLADDVDGLVFAVGRRLESGAISVAVVARTRLEGWLERLAGAGLSPNAVFTEADGVPDTPSTLTLVVEDDRIYGRAPGRPPFVFDGLSLEQVLGLVDGAGETRHLLVYID